MLSRIESEDDHNDGRVPGCERWVCTYVHEGIIYIDRNLREHATLQDVQCSTAGNTTTLVLIVLLQYIQNIVDGRERQLYYGCKSEMLNRSSVGRNRSHRLRNGKAFDSVPMICYAGSCKSASLQAMTRHKYHVIPRCWCILSNFRYFCG